jgi:translocation and assembly module TamB
VGEKLEISTRAATEKSSLELAGTLEPHGLLVNKLQFTTSAQTIWQLATPAQIVWSPRWEINDLMIETDAERWNLASGQVGEKPSEENPSGGRVPPKTAASIRLKTKSGPDGSIEFTASHFNSSWLLDWITPLSGPGWQVESFHATGHVEDRVLVFDTTLTAQIEMAPQPAQVKLSAHGDAHGIELKEFKVMDAGRVLTQATGRLPLVWQMEPMPHLSLDETAPLEVSASTEPDSPLWAIVSAATGLELTKPTAKINLTGTLSHPVGELQVNVAQLRVAPERFKYSVPEFADLTLALQFSREKISVPNFSATVDGQPIQASGQVPMNDARWQQLWREPAAFDWSEAAARVEISNADLAPLARQWPDFPVAQGRLSAHVELTPGRTFSGELHLSDAASRPLPALGALRDIKADLLLADHLFTVQTMTGTLGSEPVTLEGSVMLVPGAAPRLALRLKGQNLPLVRNTGLLLRSDLDLRADTDAAGLTRLSGALTVRDCLVLANVNLKTLLPTGLQGVTRQPPYFAVGAEPFHHWPVAVEVRAPGTVRVRTTAYNGTASANFQLGGTLGEPRAVGELTVDQGQVLFPFATFKVKQGAVRLPEADPFHAVVSLNATSQRRDYQLRLEMTGELPTPNVAISSTPVLEAADVLLLVMTGQPPASVTTTAVASGPRLALLGAYLGRGLFQDLGISGEDRLEISSGEQISEQGRETYEFEYKLSKRWSLQGEYDQFDCYNAGLKWRVFTEESTPLEKK